MSVVERLLAEGHVAELVYTPAAEPPAGDALVQLTRCGANRKISAAVEKPSENMLRCVQVAIEKNLPVLLAPGRGLESSLFLAVKAVSAAHYKKAEIVGQDAAVPDIPWLGTAPLLGSWLNNMRAKDNQEFVVAGRADIVRAQMGTQAAAQSIVGISVHAETIFVTLGGIRYTHNLSSGALLKLSTNSHDVRLESASRGIVSFGSSACRVLALLKNTPKDAAVSELSKFFCAFKAGGKIHHMNVATADGAKLCAEIKKDYVMAELCNCVSASAWETLTQSRCRIAHEQVAMKRSLTQADAASAFHWG